MIVAETTVYFGTPRNAHLFFVEDYQAYALYWFEFTYIVLFRNTEDRGPKRSYLQTGPRLGTDMTGCLHNICIVHNTRRLLRRRVLGTMCVYIHIY